MPTNVNISILEFSDEQENIDNKTEPQKIYSGIVD